MTGGHDKSQLSKIINKQNKYQTDNFNIHQHLATLNSHIDNEINSLVYKITTTDTNAIVWENEKCTEGFEYDILVNEINYLNKWLIKLDESEKMNVDIVDLYKKVKALL